MKKFFVAAAAASLFVFATSLQAATLSFSRSDRDPTLQETLDPSGAVPANARIHNFFVTTDSDILSVNQVTIDVPLFQRADGSDIEPPNPLFVTFFPGLGADSWISTPGATSIAGTGSMTTPNSTWFDSQNNGTQTNFNFARLTTIGGPQGTFSGRISLSVPGGDPVAFPFSFSIPEPSTFIMGGFALVGMVAMRRRKIA